MSTHTTTTTPAHHHNNNNNSKPFAETFRGFVKDTQDAQALIEACIAGALRPLNTTPEHLSHLRIRSGTCLVFGDDYSKHGDGRGHTARWRDGGRWSRSRLQGPFLLYREVEPTKTNVPSEDTYSKFLQTVASTEPEQCTRFRNTVLRPQTRFVPNGLAKRTITLTGSDGQRYRVISYFHPANVAHFYGDQDPTGISLLMRPGDFAELLPFYSTKQEAPAPPPVPPLTVVSPAGTIIKSSSPQLLLLSPKNFHTTTSSLGSTLCQSRSSNVYPSSSMTFAPERSRNGPELMRLRNVVDSGVENRHDRNVCPCGGLGGGMIDVRRRDPAWLQQPAWLPPLKYLQKREHERSLQFAATP
ncbi:Gti1/Pac2 family-domain-containing protein [Chytriomyces cf. hyalinus JEL632]|nr:Gti1/Pac2 family-domain-containing protein [Chytriomyces cf. hyalinus JEL632]